MDTNITPLNDIEVNVKPCNDVNLNDEKYTKLKLSSYQKSNMSLLFQQIPDLTAASAMSNAYIVSFPEGLPHTLMQLKNGQYATPIMGSKGIVGSAGLTPLQTHAVLLKSLSAMSVVTGQYFLTEINKKFELVNEKIDKIMNFLYGDKKAELISEISFVQYANTNYNTIMAHDEQRAATIISLQNAKKTAMKDIEFYMSDLNGSIVSHPKDSDVNNSLQIKESLDLSLQLFIISSIMEVFYSQNFDKDYLSSVIDFATFYINKCEKRILSDFSKLKVYLNENKSNLIKNVVNKQNTENDDKVETIINSLNNGNNSPLLESLISSLNVYDRTDSVNYYLDNAGDVYIKKDEFVS